MFAVQVERILAQLADINASLEAINQHVLLSNTSGSVTVVDESANASPLAGPSVPSPETEQRQELARLQARNAQELERIQARNVELMAKSAELQQRQLRLQRRVFAMERRRVLHEVTHLVNRDVVERNHIMRAQGVSVQGEEADYLLRQADIVWKMAHRPRPQVAQLALVNPANNA